jgi:hypothetical protein
MRTVFPVLAARPDDAGEAADDPTEDWAIVVRR